MLLHPQDNSYCVLKTFYMPGTALGLHILFKPTNSFVVLQSQSVIST